VHTERRGGEGFAASGRGRNQDLPGGAGPEAGLDRAPESRRSAVKAAACLTNQMIDALSAPAEAVCHELEEADKER
jgi:hypothetical protein